MPILYGEVRYLGDGVYASFDGYQIWLDTRAQEPVNRIALETDVFNALLLFNKDLQHEISLMRAATDREEASP